MCKKILTMTVLAIMLLGVLLPAVSFASETMYIYTENGKTLNMRYEPQTGDNVFITLPYGRKVTVAYHLGNGWSAISWDGEIYYVQTRYLVYNKPGPKPTPAPKKGGDGSTTIAELNSIFKTYKLVSNPYSITVRPTRASGWVNLRFAPTKQSQLMATYRSNEKLLVIAELKDWYQVEDPDTGAVGYLSTKFVAK